MSVYAVRLTHWTSSIVKVIASTGSSFMNLFVFSFFLLFLAQALHGQVNECQVGEETIKIPNPTGFKRIDQLKDLAMAFSGNGFTLLEAFGSSDDYARLSGGRFPALREAYFRVDVKDDAAWTTVSQKGFAVYKASTLKAMDKEVTYPSRLDKFWRSNNEEALRKLREIYPCAHYESLGLGIVVVLEDTPDSIMTAYIGGPTDSTSYIAAHGPGGDVSSSSLISGKIIFQRYSFWSYTSPADVVRAVEALRTWRNDTFALNAK